MNIFIYDLCEKCGADYVIYSPKFWIVYNYLIENAIPHVISNRDEINYTNEDLHRINQILEIDKETLNIELFSIWDLEGYTYLFDLNFKNVKNDIEELLNTNLLSTDAKCYTI